MPIRSGVDIIWTRRRRALGDGALGVTMTCSSRWCTSAASDLGDLRLPPAAARRVLERAVDGLAVRKSALDIVLCYREDQAPSAKMAFNQQLADALPSWFDGYKSNQSDGRRRDHGQRRRCSTCKLPTTRCRPGHRISVVVHEYFHVVQKNMCGNTADNNNPHFVMWVWEGMSRSSPRSSGSTTTAAAAAATRSATAATTSATSSLAPTGAPLRTPSPGGEERRLHVR